MEKENVVSPNEVSLLFESRISTTLVFWSWQDCMFYSSLQLLKSFAILGYRLLNPPLLTYLELIASQVKEVKEFRLCSNLLNIEIYQLQNSFSDPQHNICTSSSLKEHRICKKKKIFPFSLSQQREGHTVNSISKKTLPSTHLKSYIIYTLSFLKNIYSQWHLQSFLTCSCAAFNIGSWISVYIRRKALYPPGILSRLLKARSWFRIISCIIAGFLASSIV